MDSTNAYALFGIGQAQFALLNNTDVPWTEGVPMLREYCRRALLLDPNEVNSRAHLAWLTFAYDWEYDIAVKELSVLMAEYPQNTAVMDSYGALLLILNKYEEALEIHSRMRRNDPLDPRSYGGAGLVYSRQGQLDNAYTEFMQCHELNPRNPDVMAMLGVIKLKQGKPNDALDILKDQTCVPCLIVSCIAYYDQGNPTLAYETLKNAEINFGRGYPAYIATAYASMGDNERAFYWMEQAVKYKDYGLPLSIGDSFFNKLRDTPGFKMILKQINLDR